MACPIPKASAPTIPAGTINFFIIKLLSSLLHSALRKWHTHRNIYSWGLNDAHGHHSAGEDNKEPAKEAAPPPPPPEDKQASLPPAVDCDALAEMMGGFDDDAIEMLEMFVEMTSPQIDQIASSYAANDKSQLHELGHSLKGSARSACCPLLGDLGEKLEKQGEGAEDCRELVQDIIEEFARVRGAIEKLAADGAPQEAGGSAG